jgi:6-phosphogluconolactonase
MSKIVNSNIQPYTPEAVAERLLITLGQIQEQKERVILGVPGGRSPGPVITALAQRLDQEILDKLTLTWIDERWVALNHVDRNDLLILKAWLEGGALPETILPLPGIGLDSTFTNGKDQVKISEAQGPKFAYHGDEIDLAKEEFENYLVQIYGTGSEPESFGLDVALIGIGEDGHLASLFPSHPSLDAKGTIIVCSDSPKPPAQRLSFSLSSLKACKYRYILVLGPEKGRVLAQASKGEQADIPVSLVLDSSVCFLDEEAMLAYEQTIAELE